MSNDRPDTRDVRTVADDDTWDHDAVREELLRRFGTTDAAAISTADYFDAVMYRNQE